MTALLLLLVLAAAPSGADGGSTVSIRFREHAEVDGPSIRLGEIARIVADEDREVARLESLVVAKAAAFGLTRVLDTESLLARHQALLGPGYILDADRKSIKVTTRSVLLPADSLARRIDEFLAAQERGEGEKRTWEMIRAPAELRVPAAPHSLEVGFSGIRRKGKVELGVAIRAQGRIVRTLPVTVNVRVEEPVLVALRTVPLGEVLDASNSKVEIRETTQMNDLAMAEPARLQGRVAKVTIAPGRIVTPLMVAMPPVVRRGQEAKLIYRQGDVKITTGVVCRQDGIPGQIITATSLVNRRLLRVRVTDAGHLEPVPGG
ncbi:MAG TPA: flagellar basal body P-ring formation chaperone FlgA [Geothrix sp.]|nr:flagellar basal body P-ring formation chaperone FlgA [Geothrix sp.]